MLKSKKRWNLSWDPGCQPPKWILPTTHTTPQTCNVPQRYGNRGQAQWSLFFIPTWLFPWILVEYHLPRLLPNGPGPGFISLAKCVGTDPITAALELNFTTQTLHPLGLRPNSIACLWQWPNLEGRKMSDEEVASNPICLIGVQGEELELWFPVRSHVYAVIVVLFIFLYWYAKTVQISVDGTFSTVQSPLSFWLQSVSQSSLRSLNHVVHLNLIPPLCFA